MYINMGTWEDNVPGLTHSVYRNFTVNPGGALFNAANSNTVQFLGPLPANLTYNGTLGYFHNLTINKSPGVQVTQVGSTSCQFDGNLTVQQGIYSVNGYSFVVTGNTAINNNGKLLLPAASVFYMLNGFSLNVNSGGTFQAAGTPGSPVTVRANIPTSRFNVNVNSGGTIAADYCIFQNQTAGGVNVKSGATIDAAHAFTGCTFQDGATGGSLLTIDNNQVLNIPYAVFPANTWGGSYNVTKSLNQGNVTFLGYSGNFAGEDFDNDPNNRISWVPENNTVSGTVSSGMSNCYDAHNTLTVGGGGLTFVVQTGGSATHIAGQKISYLYGTLVEPGGYMHGYITPTDNYCGIPVPPMVATVTGTEEVYITPASAEFAIYPNPTTGKFTLALKNGEILNDVRVDILSLRGEFLRTETLNNERSHDFNMSLVPEGLYFVKIMRNGHSESFKLIVNR
jgi:hypothetical protein